MHAEIYSRCDVRKGDVLYVKDGAGTGAVALNTLDEPFSLLSSVGVLRPGPALFPKYLLYALQEPDTKRSMLDNVAGVAITRLTLKKLNASEIPIAPPAEQARIVAKLEELLSDLDAGVAELKAAQKKLQQYRQSLLKAAVEGALTASWREAHRAANTPLETGAQLLERILRERRARWEKKQLAKFKEQGKTPSKDWQKKYPEPVAPDTTGLPELPKGWVWASLDQLLSRLRSGTAETSTRELTPYPVLKSSAVRQGKIDFGALNYLHADQCRNDDYLEDGDLLISRLSGSVEYVGCCAVVQAVPPMSVQYPDRIFCGKLSSPSQHIAIHVVNTLRSPSARIRIEAAAKSTAGHKRISLSDLHPFPVPLPPLAEMAALGEIVQTALTCSDDMEAALELARKQSTAQRQNILRAAFAGQLVPQDPDDEPASMLLERIRSERAAQPATKKPRGRKTEEAAA
nr:restriction endonuclease subunit S [Massilia rhizosphaerae]